MNQAISDPRTATHEGWTIFSAFDANNSAIVADAVTQYGHSLTDGEISKHYAIQVRGMGSLKMLVYSPTSHIFSYCCAS